MINKEFPLKIEKLSTRETNNYSLVSAKEIQAVIKSLAASECLVALYWDENKFILTTVLGVDSTGLWLGQSRNEADNRSVTESGQLYFVSYSERVKIQFKLKSARTAVFGGSLAFFIPLPDSICRLQRREYYRLAVLDDQLHCIVAPDTLVEPACDLVVLDISCGGVGLLCTANHELELGKAYQHCLIDLPEVGVVDRIIQVKTLTSRVLPSGLEYKRVGCEFADVKNSSDISLQKYITNRQRAKNNLDF